MGIPTVKWGKEIQHIFVPSLELISVFFFCSCGNKSQNVLNLSHQAKSLTWSWHAVHCSAGHLGRGENFLLIYFVLFFFRLSTINLRYTYNPDLWDIHPHQHYVAGCSCNIVTITFIVIVTIITIIVVIINNITARMSALSANLLSPLWLQCTPLHHRFASRSNWFTCVFYGSRPKSFVKDNDSQKRK